MESQLTESEIKDLAALWYKKLDVHAPMVEVLPLLAEENVEMKFPEATLHGLADFEGWYQRVIRIFFDEVHRLKEVTVKINGDSADVHVVVEWQASVWNPPAANSARIKLDADQTWVVKKSPPTGKAVIAAYIVNSLNYHEGSARL
ncbi:MAG: hypothetical protein Q8P42_02430 [Gallionella sp.]|nr:hypothetical protein [Gallionella sp.]